jgi:hypothetical protein
LLRSLRSHPLQLPPFSTNTPSTHPPLSPHSLTN